MLTRLIVAIGTVAAAVGFMFIGIGQATPENIDWMVNSGFVLLVAGIVLAAVGAFLYRSTEKAAEALIAARTAQQGGDHHRQAG